MPAIHSSHLASALTRCAKQHLNLTALRVLCHLADKPGCSASHLAEVTSTSTPNITGIIDSLEARHFVKRTREKKDRRLVLIQITPAGQSALTSILCISA